ncbi:DUF262 domain-containing protein [Kocuria marina]|uniref:DUF262 domain-containing protein n=1 Tax=Kocuria marina TaxID=223184 RepID=UPI002989B07D|nr:DUF262 domain-containing protein [Kocuria marina]MCT1722994.1 DUF262 domain-containing protein [Kocuria marina]MCT1734942.1 DUF262 domain-containing protein [Kocuria marina]
MSSDVSVPEAEVEDWFDEEEETPPTQMEPEKSQSADEKYAQSQLRVIRETKDYQLDYLRHALQPGSESIHTSPEYQRRLRWPLRKRSLLIESFLLNIPVPPIFMFERDYNEYEVIDGRQRLEAIRSFLGNEFALTGLEYWPELNRKRFRELPSVLQRGLLRRSLSAVVLLAETRAVDDQGIDVRRVLFDRLNTGGVKLNPQELRNALYPGELNSLIMSLARTDIFTRVWGIPPYTAEQAMNPSQDLLSNSLFSSLADAELVLRVFAISEALNTGRSGSLKRLLDNFMEREQHAQPAQLQAMEESFLSSLSTLDKVFEGNPFRLPGSGRRSRPMYDAFMVAANHMDKASFVDRAERIRHRLNAAFKHEGEYEVLVGRGNTMDSIRARVDLAKTILEEGQ